MPTFNTGDPQWDQGLSSLGNALFPDPSKVAQGYYYGSEARKAQLESNALIARQNAENQVLQMQDNRMPFPAAPSFYQPNNVPGAAPILGPSPNLPMSAGPGQPAPLPPPTMSLPQTTQFIAGRLQPGMAGGTPPPFSSPAPNAGASPQTPTTTTTDGQTPSNDMASAVIHPGSITPPVGGPKYAPPANADGSPARPSVNLGTLMAYGSAAGYDAAKLQTNGQAVITQAFKEGRIDATTMDRMLAGLGQPGPLQETMRGQTARDTTAMTVKGELARQQMVTGEQAREFTKAPMIVRGPDGQSYSQPRDVVQTPQPGSPLGMPLFDQTLENTRLAATVAPVSVVPAGAPPGTPPVSATTAEAQTGPLANRPTIYQPGTADILAQQTGAYGLFLDQNGKLVHAPAGQAQTQGLTPVPATTDAANAAMIAQIRSETDPQKQQRLIDLYNSTPTVPKPVDATENAKNQFLIDKQLQLMMPVPTGFHTRTNLLPAGASPELGRILSDLSDQYFLRGDIGVKGNRIAATNAALKQLAVQQYIYPNQDRDTGFSSNASTSVNKPVFDKAGNPLAPEPHFQVHLYKPGTDQIYGPGQAPKVMMTTPSLSSAMPIGTAPPGMPEGPGTVPGIGRVVNRGGILYMAQ